MWFGIANSSVGVDGWQLLQFGNDMVTTSLQAWELPLLFVGGFLLLFVTLHLARGIGKLHGLFAKHLLVKSAQYA